MARPSVMIIDDDAEFLSVAKTYLEDVADVTVACSGRQAIQLAQEISIDVILLDFEMPIMDGMKTLSHLRNLKASINVPVIMLTGRNDPYAVKNSLVMGIDGYLLKPVSKDALIETVMDVYWKKTERGNKKVILAIDDDMYYLKQLNSFLKDTYHVVMINSARLALNYLSNHVPDLILLDYKIPLFNGVTLIKLIQQNSSCQDIPFIILSGALDIDALKEFYPYSPASILAKPVEKEVLMEHIKRALSEF